MLVPFVVTARFAALSHFRKRFPSRDSALIVLSAENAIGCCRPRDGAIGSLRDGRGRLAAGALSSPSIAGVIAPVVKSTIDHGPVWRNHI